MAAAHARAYQDNDLERRGGRLNSPSICRATAIRFHRSTLLAVTFFLLLLIAYCLFLGPLGKRAGLPLIRLPGGRNSAVVMRSTFWLRLHCQLSNVHGANGHGTTGRQPTDQCVVRQTTWGSMEMLGLLNLGGLLPGLRLARCKYPSSLADRCGGTKGASVTQSEKRVVRGVMGVAVDGRVVVQY